MPFELDFEKLYVVTHAHLHTQMMSSDENKNMNVGNMHLYPSQAVLVSGYGNVSVSWNVSVMFQQKAHGMRLGLLGRC